jgi:hypothetical protein
VKRLVAQELILSFVPAPEQRLGRTATRTKVHLTRNRVQLQNRLEALLDQAYLTRSSLGSDLLGASARRILEALADGATDPGRWRPWLIIACGPPRSSCAMRLRPARNSVRSTDAS